MELNVSLTQKDSLEIVSTLESSDLSHHTLTLLHFFVG